MLDSHNSESPVPEGHLSGLVKPLVIAGVTVAVGFGISVAAASLSQRYKLAKQKQQQHQPTPRRRPASATCCEDVDRCCKKPKVELIVEKDADDEPYDVRLSPSRRFSTTTNCGTLRKAESCSRMCAAAASATTESKGERQSDRGRCWKQTSRYPPTKTPVAERNQNCSTTQNVPVCFGFGSVQGHRESNEDRCVAMASLPINTHAAFFGIYDGHCGQHASQFVSETLHVEIDKQLEVVERDDLLFW